MIQFCGQNVRSCLQETKLNHISGQVIASICGQRFSLWDSISTSGSIGGLLTCWDPNEAEGSQYNQDKFSISTEFILKSHSARLSWLLTNVYGPTEPRLRKNFFEELLSIKTKWQGPWILFGDFTNNTAVSRDFNALIDTLQLSEL